MYKVYSDGQLLYHSKLENLKLFDPTVELELNKTGSFGCIIYPDHPRYSTVNKLKSIITVFQDDFQLFRGRVLDDEIGWHNEKNIFCEGDFAFLLDSVQRPFTFSGTAAEFLAYVLNLHNVQVDASKHFQAGNVTVDGTVSYDETEYLTSKETLEKALLEPFGGYLMTRFENGVAYLDYLAEITLLAPQSIKFGKNLLDLKRIRKGADIATVIIPLGAVTKDEEGNDTGKRLTIESVNGGADFVQDADAIAQFGTIVKSVTFDGITDPAELKAAGQAHLAESVNQWETIELSAADLATVDKSFTSFHLGTQVNVESSPHGLKQRMIVSKLSIKLLDPGANKLTLGNTVAAFSDAVSGIANNQQMILQTVEKSVQAESEALANVERNMLASMQVVEGNIKTTVSESYTLKEDTEALISDVRLEVTQTKESYDMEFIQFRQDLDAATNGSDAQFEEIRKYIRFPDGKILLGEVGNELELEISNDRISFLQDGAEVAYFSNRKLYVTDAEILHSLQLGAFAFMPRANGNLSFKKTS